MFEDHAKEDIPNTIKKLVRLRSTLSNTRNVPYLVTDWTVAVAAVAISYELGGTFIYVAATIIIGTRMRAIGNLLHEASHHKLFANRRLNDLVGMALCAWPIMTAYGEYTKLHRLHHVHLWEIGRDPDISLYVDSHTEYSSTERISYKKFYFLNVVLVVLLVLPIRRLAKSLTKDLRKAVTIATIILLISSLVVFSPTRTVGNILMYYWLVPYLTSYQAISYWAELGEHAGLRAQGRKWGTRNWRGNPVSRWIIGSHSDDPYHLLHHWFPSVPHYGLHRLDKECITHWPRYANQQPSSGFFWSARADRSSVVRDIWNGGISVHQEPELERINT